MTVRSDGTLVLAVLDGDAESFGVLVRRHQAAMFRYAVRMCGDRDDADDVVQSAFVRAYRNLAQCREGERFAAWVRQIVMNECRTLLATRGRRSRWFVTDEAVLAAAESPTPIMDPEGPELGRIERALGTLTSDLREAFLLKHMEELSYEEMAQLTGAGVSALKMRVKRACEQLREQLESRDDG
jgi:RNA polymerase sigma-70 factor (ECF subfamily)